MAHQDQYACFLLLVNVYITIIFKRRQGQEPDVNILKSISFQYATLLEIKHKIHILDIAGVVKLVDALDSKSSGPCARVGSTPTSGTMKKQGFIPAIAGIKPFYVALNKTSANIPMRLPWIRERSRSCCNSASTAPAINFPAPTRSHKGENPKNLYPCLSGCTLFGGDS